MPIALDRRIAYFAEHLSDNIGVTPEGYRICRNAVIGRSGFQTYKVHEISDPENLLGERFSPDEELQLWRDPDEVFAPATLASFEGKTFTITHPEELLTPDTEREHHSGHVQNVRKGTEPLASQDWPLLADIIVTDADAIRAIDSGARELSCGYTYKLARKGYRWDQTEILGNHVALVTKGRAGAEAKIYDAAPERREFAVTLKQIIGSFFKAAKPEEIEAALSDKEVVFALTGAPAVTRSVAVDTKEKEPVADSADFVSVGKTADGIEIFKRKDAKPLVVVAKDDGMEEENTAADRRKRLHDALDRRLLDAEEKEKSAKAQEDADIGELRKLMDEFLGEEEKESEHKDAAADAHPKGCRCGDCMDAKDAEEKEEEKAGDAEEEKKEGEDAEEEEKADDEIVRPEPVLSEGNRVRRVFDGEMTMELLRAFKPVVAKSTDKRVKAAFDTLYKGFRASLKGAKASKGSYAMFLKTASHVNEEDVRKATDAADVFTPPVSEIEKMMQENDKIYAEAGKKLREKVQASTAARR